ncbi:MAG: YHS domain-containing protein [Kofleriaceae bacterium]|nr:YHS domain-containing protein [Kofleriaceae bacterium]
MTAAEHTFVFADLAGYTALTEAHGDEDAAQVATEFHELAKHCLPAGSRIVKTIGDAVMVVAPSIGDGIATAVRVAATIAGQARFPAVRIGIHAGPAASRDGDYFGAAVNIAARVAALARAGEIVCTEAVAAVAVARALAPARPMGTVRLKNVSMPLALFELGTGAPTGRLHHLDPVCRMQIDPATAATTLAQDGVLLYFCSAGCRARFEAAPEAYLLEPAGTPG